MADNTSPLLAALLSILLLLPSLWARSAWSGKAFSEPKFFISVVYNTLLIALHMNFAKSGELPLLGQVDNSQTGWLSACLVIAHGFSVPSAHGKNSAYSDSEHLYPSADEQQYKGLESIAGKIFGLIKAGVLVICCSVTATAITISALSYILSLDITSWRILAVSTLGLFICIGIYGSWSHARKHGEHL